MPETKVQKSPADAERKLAPRSEYDDVFSTGPYGMMRRLNEEMHRAFDNVFGGTWNFGTSGTWSPAIEVREKDGSIEIAAELPGVTKDDVKVESTDQGIVIQGEKRQEHDETVHGIHRSERSYGTFYRLIPLPKEAQADKATAEFKNGMLQVRVPIAENRQQRRQINIAA